MSTTTEPTRSSRRVTATPPAGPALAARHFLGRLQFETDPSDVRADLEAGVDDLVVVDARSRAEYRAGHVAGAVSLPYREIDERTREFLPTHAVVVVYGSGPACNAATKAAAALAALGYRVKEMTGGVEYWRHAGFPLEQTPPAEGTGSAVA